MPKPDGDVLDGRWLSPWERDVTKRLFVLQLRRLTDRRALLPSGRP